MTSRVGSLVAVVALFVAACSSSDDQQSETTVVADTVSATPPPGTAPPDETPPGATSTTGVTAPPDIDRSPLRAAEAFGWLPAVSLVDNDSGVRGRVMASAVDWMAVADYAELPIPTSNEVAAAPDGPDSAYRQWYRTAAFEDGGGLWLSTRAPLGEAIDHQSEMLDSFGFGHADFVASASLSITDAGQPTIFFDAIRSPAEPAGALVELGDGVSTLGGGEDFERNVEQITSFQPFGAPIRVARMGFLTGVSESTALVTRWKETSDRLIEDPRYSALATAFDGFEVLELWTFEADFSLARQQETDSIPVDPSFVPIVPAPFTVVAGLTTVFDGQLTTFLGYVFDNAVIAADMVAPLRAMWTDPTADSLYPRVSDTARVTDVSSSGQVAIVTLAITPGTGMTDSILSWVALAEHLFVHL